VMAFLNVALLVATAAALIWLSSRRNLSPALMTSLAAYFVMWLVTPVVAVLCAWDRITSRWMVVPGDRFLRMAAIEIAAFLATVIWFGLSRRRTYRWITRAGISRWSMPRRLENAAIIAAAVVDILIRRQMLAIVGSTYSEANAFAVTAQGSLAAALLNVLLLFDTVLSSFLMAVLLRRRSEGRAPRAIVLLVWAWVIGTSLMFVLAGSRLALITPCVLLLVYIHNGAMSRHAIIVAYSAMAIFGLTIGVATALVIGAMRGGSGQLQLSTAAAESKSLFGQQPMSETAWAFYDQIYIKFDGISMGAYLVDRLGRAGIKPYVGAALAIVPRIILPSKPTPGSIDGTLQGTPPRLIAVAIGMDPLVGNVGVSSAAMEMWHFGWLGLIPLLLFNLFQWRMINSFLLTPSLVTRTLALYLIAIPSFAGLFTSGDIVVMNCMRMLVLFLGAAVLHYALRGAVPLAPRRPIVQT